MIIGMVAVCPSELLTMYLVADQSYEVCTYVHNSVINQPADLQIHS